jgi:ABC-2 type transport system ATP-binding protein
MNAVETVGLGKRYRSVWALEDCTLSIPSGSVVALVGPNGAGKSTLLHCIVGLCRPTTGSVTVVDGIPAGTEDALAAVAFVAQQAPLPGHLRVGATLDLAAVLNRSFDRRLAEERLDTLRIPLGKRVGRLSGGQQAQLSLSIAVARHPALLVLDEPLAPLDPLARYEFVSHLMSQAAEQGMSVLLSSHLVSEIDRVADHLVVLSDGQVQVAGDVDDLLAAHANWCGPSDEVDLLAAVARIVYADVGGRQARVLVRLCGGEPPPGWEADPVGVEELVLGYLRTPTARALPGPCGLVASGAAGAAGPAGVSGASGPSGARGRS